MEKKFLKVGNNINFKFNTDGLEYDLIPGIPGIKSYSRPSVLNLKFILLPTFKNFFSIFTDIIILKYWFLSLLSFRLPVYGYVRDNISFYFDVA